MPIQRKKKYKSYINYKWCLHKSIREPLKRAGPDESRFWRGGMLRGQLLSRGCLHPQEDLSLKGLGQEAEGLVFEHEESSCWEIKVQAKRRQSQQFVSINKLKRKPKASPLNRQSRNPVLSCMWFHPQESCQTLKLQEAGSQKRSSVWCQVLCGLFSPEAESQPGEGVLVTTAGSQWKGLDGHSLVSLSYQKSTKPYQNPRSSYSNQSR